MNTYVCTVTETKIKVELKTDLSSSFMTHEIEADSVKEATRKFLNWLIINE